jgi:hypothetical protein
MLIASVYICTDIYIYIRVCVCVYDRISGQEIVSIHLGNDHEEFQGFIFLAIMVINTQLSYTRVLSFFIPLSMETTGKLSSKEISCLLSIFHYFQPRLFLVTVKVFLLFQVDL